uniref:Uncharacterized protein n=1 Tax=Lactuca sativa TaxID=4236 RepID=A0A9R1VEK2_LACSA|nr:hypothetical protein LSAT_V11C500234940 [Lactuca sativa]
MSTSIYELFRYSLFPGLFVAFTYNKKEPPVFGAAPAFWCILLSFLGLPFRHVPNNLSNDNELTANAPFFYQISGTWSNHEVFMDSFFVTGVDPRAIMSQNEEAIEKVFFIPLSQTL